MDQRDRKPRCTTGANDGLTNANVRLFVCHLQYTPIGRHATRPCFFGEIGRPRHTLVHPTNDGHTKSDSEFTPEPVSSDLDDDREDMNPLFYGSR